MKDLLTEAEFKFTTINGRLSIDIKSFYKDGITTVAVNQQNIVLTDYGLHALEKNIASILWAIEIYNNNKKPYTSKMNDNINDLLMVVQ